MQRLLRKTVWLVIIPLTASLIYSCQQEEISESIDIKQSENFVNLDQAAAIASVIEYPIRGKPYASGRVTSTFKDIESVLEIPDENGTPSFYIINYEDNGYIMISADNRTEPIRSYSLTDKFPFNADEYPNGLIDWLTETNDMISEIRVLDSEQTLAVANSWDNCEMQMVIQPIGDGGGCGNDGGGGGGCENTSTTIGPLLSTVWGQTGGYNDLVEDINCSSGASPTGCVATAMGQIMKFHEFPANYNWEDMPDGWGTDETAILMRDIGQAVGMNYSCDVSGANSGDAATAFKNTFGYSDAIYTNFDHQKIKQQLRWNRPVYLAANRSKKCFLGWCSYQNGHAWVCDGYRSIYYCDIGVGYLYLYMNWGWNGGLNGWYAYNRWNPEDRDYKYNKRMIYNIRP